MSRPIRRAALSALAVTTFTAAGLLATAAPASAQTFATDGPLTRVQITPDLNCDVGYAGDSAPEFYDSTACGTFVAVSDGTTSTLYGPADVPAGANAAPRTAFTPDSQTVTGTGTSADPYGIATAVRGGDDVFVVQTDYYVTGQNYYTTETRVTPRRSGLTLRTFYGADCYLQNSDTGYGDPVPANGTVSCRGVDPDTGGPGQRIEQFIPRTPGSRYYYGSYAAMWSEIGAQQLTNEVSSPETRLDNGFALQWTSAAGASELRTSRLTNFSPRNEEALTSALTVPASAQSGSTVPVSFTITNPNDSEQTVRSVTVTVPPGAEFVPGSASTGLGTPRVVGGGTGTEFTFTPTLTAPPNGTATGAFQARLTNTPAGDYTAQLSGATSPAPLNGSSAPIRVTAAPVNHAPVATDGNATTQQDTSVDVTLKATDADGDQLTYAVATQPTHGTLSGTAPNLTYTPATGYSGPDSFTFTAKDAQSTSNPATFSITVTAAPTNTAPTANDQAVTTGQDQPAQVTLSGFDQENDPLTYAVTSPPSHGALSGTAPNLTYTPAAGYSGSDSFQFTVNDGHSTSAPGTVSITVTPASRTNTPPTADNVEASTQKDKPVRVTLSGSDADGDSLTYTVVTRPAHGTLSGTAPDLLYTPARGTTGTDTFTYTVSDGTDTSAPATVTITVAGKNHPPVAHCQLVKTKKGEAVGITLRGTDADGDALTYATTAPSHGTLTGTGRTRTYTPAAGFTGIDRFTFTVNDGKTTSAPATVVIVVKGNSTPIANGQKVNTCKGKAIRIVLSAWDADRDALTYRISRPAHGQATLSGRTVTYTPDAGYSGKDSFTFTASDASSTSAPATVAIDVRGRS